jgi:autoinducer 2-degrading protein
MSASEPVGLFVVIVDFVVQREHAEAFSRLMLENAHASRTLEEGCIQFDVCQPADDPARFFLYELYKDAEAFQIHLASTHFKTFDATVKPWIADKRVQTMARLAP